MDGNSTVRVGVLGYGNVGAAVVALIAENGDTIAARTGLRLEVTRVAVSDLSKVRSGFDTFTADAASVAVDPEVDLVVEVMGGLDPAKDLVLSALKAGKPVVTANKELMAACGAELFDAAAKAGVDLLFEAAVAGAIPIIRPLRESLAGDRIKRVLGIVNGTTNFILTRMTESGQTFAEALAEAQALGYAERDPTADVEGHDAAAKASIIASLAFGVRVVAGDVYREGITGVTADDIRMAGRLGYVVKLLAVIDDVGGEVAVRVHPAMVPFHHPLASVRESFNAVFIEGDAVGSLMFYGRGAGGLPTASAVLGDVIDAAVNLRKGTHAQLGTFGRARMRPIDETTAEYLLSLEVADRPGVLHAVTGVFARHDVSIRAAEQEGNGPDARLVFITHDAKESAVQATVRELRDLDVVLKVGGLLRVIGA